MKTAEVIASGSELTSGDRLNTNAQWISQQLVALGVTPRWHTTLADQMADHIEALSRAEQRVDIVIMTGGLGPTQDDLTREAFAQVAGTGLVFDQQLLKSIEEIFIARGVVMPERNRVQAYTPKGARPIPNPVGTAPGIWLEREGKVLVALPGVPREMKHMWTESVAPWLAKKLGHADVVLSHKINLFGLGESAVEEKVMDLTARGRIPEVGITASEAVISLRIVARTSDRSEADRQIAETRQEIWRRLEPYIYSEGDSTPAESLGERLASLGLTLAIGEIGTNALLAHRVLTAAGNRAVVRPVFAHSWAEWRRTALADSGDDIGRISEQLREKLNCDLALAISANALDGNMFGYTIAFANNGNVSVKNYQSKGTANEILSRAVNVAIHHAIKSLATSSRNS